MARALFSTKDLIPKLPSSITVRSSASLKGLLQIRSKGIPRAKILAAFEKGINNASQRIAVDLKAALDRAIQSPVWTVPSGRADIYETGELMASGTVSVTPNGVTIAYSAPYAALVHFGGYINPYGNESVRIYLPPRPWVDAVLNGRGSIEAFDFERYYREEIEKAFD